MTNIFNINLLSASPFAMVVNPHSFGRALTSTFSAIYSFFSRLISKNRASEENQTPAKPLNQNHIVEKREQNHLKEKIDVNTRYQVLLLCNKIKLGLPISPGQEALLRRYGPKCVGSEFPQKQLNEALDKLESANKSFQPQKAQKKKEEPTSVRTEAPIVQKTEKPEVPEISRKDLEDLVWCRFKKETPTYAQWKRYVFQFQADPVNLWRLWDLKYTDFQLSKNSDNPGSFHPYKIAFLNEYRKQYTYVAQNQKLTQSTIDSIGDWAYKHGL